MKHEPQLGSISEGTLKTEDLLLAFGNELERLDPEAAEKLYKEHPENDKELLDEITEALEALDCPPYWRFGAHEGDGACFGWWIDWELIDRDIRDGSLLKRADYLESSALPQVVVGAHGNVSFYDPVGVLVWDSP